ncbi:MAG: amidohydrolase family protein [Myxococcales bacterium]|nr:amidohydrolase family protein [Myxococcales bacterium]
MDFDLTLRQGRLPDGRVVDVGIAGDRIAAVAPRLPAGAGPELDCREHLLTPPFVDAHFHLDAARALGDRVNRSGTLLEGINLWGDIKPELTVQAVYDRALAYCDLAVAQGIGAIRTHVDVCDPRLVAVEALLAVREAVKPYLHLQLVAFPQDGYLRDPQAVALVDRALDLGVDVVGGIPHFERTTADGDASVAALCRLAAERGLLVDMHCDETDDPASRHVETLAREALRHGLQGRVVGSHLTSMHAMPDAYVAKLLPLMAEAGLGAVSNPAVNLHLQGRFDGYPRRRGLTRVPELQAAGVPVAFGQDCVQDPWYPLGTGDLLDMAWIGAHATQQMSQAGLRACFDAVTTAPAALLHLEGYGLEVGCRADLVALPAADPVDAVRRRPARRFVVAAGKLVAETAPRETRLALPGRPLSPRW